MTERSGAFQAVIAPTTPAGTRRTRVSPDLLVPGDLAEQLGDQVELLDRAGGLGLRDHARSAGRARCTIVRVISSARASVSRASLRKIAARSATEVSRPGGKGARPRPARRGPRPRPCPRGIVAISSSVAGLVTVEGAGRRRGDPLAVDVDASLLFDQLCRASPGLFEHVLQLPCLAHRPRVAAQEPVAHAVLGDGGQRFGGMPTSRRRRGTSSAPKSSSNGLDQRRGAARSRVGGRPSAAATLASPCRRTASR